MHEERFRKLIEAVEATPEAEFDMGCWTRRTECGTVGCAVGNYVLRNPQCGLRMFFLSDCRIAEGFMSGGYRLVAEHFCISESAVKRLFEKSSYPDNATKSVVLARLLKFYEQHRKPSESEVNAGLDRLLSDIEATPADACMAGLNGDGLTEHDSNRNA